MMEEKMEMKGPAYRILTERLMLRCWNPEDAEMLQPVIDDNLVHLRAWMPWAMHEPQTVEAKARRIRGFRAAFDEDRDFGYGILSRDGGRVLGGTGLHPRIGPGGVEIGYWIRRDEEGRGLVAEATRAIVRAAFELHGVRRVEIRCDPANARSAAIPARLGFTHEGTLRHNQLDSDDRPRDTMVWAILDTEYRAGPIASFPIEAFDALGRRVI
ncbi:MAG TPA: GNAT family protein [Longimicrobium sp.]|nr:GNAT family protein [Longimicrobium sp.]